MLAMCRAGTLKLSKSTSANFSLFNGGLRWGVGHEHYLFLWGVFHAIPVQ